MGKHDARDPDATISFLVAFGMGILFGVLFTLLGIGMSK